MTAAGGQHFSGAPPKPGPSTMQAERHLLEQMQVCPTTEPLKQLGELKRHKEFMANSPAVATSSLAKQSVASSSKKTLDIGMPPPVDWHMLKFGGKHKQVRKTLLKRMGLPTTNIPVNFQGMQKGKSPLTPENIEVSEEEVFFGDNNINREIVESAGISAIQIDDDGCGAYGIFDDHYDLRQVHLLNDRIHANDLNAKQDNQYVACSSNKLRIGDVYDKIQWLPKLSQCLVVLD